MLAGMMLASVLVLDSCKKTQSQQSLPSIFENGEAPVVDTIIYGDRDTDYTCPYCGENIPVGTLNHWHAFGEAPETYTGPAPVGTYDDCMVAYAGSNKVCPYSGRLYNDESMIAYIMEFYGIDHDAAQDRLRPRFHAHNLTYILFGEDGGTNNHWHVGGGVPGWPNP